MKLMHKGAVLAALAGGMVLASGGVASADTGATGAAFGSPGVLSGNVFQMPINLPMNACGSSLNLLDLLNPAFGSSCGNVSVRSVTTQPLTSMDDSRNNGHGGWHHEGEKKDPAAWHHEGEKKDPEKNEKKDPGQKDSAKKDPAKGEKKDPGKKDSAKKDPGKGEKKDPGKKDPEKNGKKDPGKKDSENHFHHEVHHVKTHRDCK